MTTDPQRSRFAEYRDRKRGGPPVPRKLKPHGSYAAARRHVRNHDVESFAELVNVCKPCYRAWLDYQAEMYRRRQEAGA